jgi:hypothetical protein
MQRAARTDTAREGTLGLDANRRHTTRTHATYAIRHEGLRGMGALGKLARRRCRIERMRCATSSETHDGARVPCCAGCVWLQQRCNNQCDVQHTTYNLPRNRPQTTRCSAVAGRTAWSRCMKHAAHTNWGTTQRGRRAHRPASGPGLAHRIALHRPVTASSRARAQRHWQGSGVRCARACCGTRCARRRRACHRRRGCSSPSRASCCLPQPCLALGGSN